MSATPIRTQTRPTSLAQRLRAAWNALSGKRAGDAYAATYGQGAGMTGFAGGSINRLTASLANWSGSVNADLDASLPILRARARSLSANNEHGKRFLSLVATNVVGRRNPKLQVRAMRDQRDPSKATTLDKAANDAIEIHWDRWGRTADITGRHKSLYSLMRTAVKGAARDGEALVRIVRDRNLPYGMGLQLLEADRLEDARNQRLDNGNTVRQGVEIDSRLRAVAYWIRTSHPGENYATAAAGVERVPASEMIHLFLSERAEQVRGITWMHAIIMRGSIIHQFEEAAVVAAKIGASKIAALERAEDAPDATASMADGISGGNLQINVEAGEMFELPPGYKMASWNPDYPHQNFESFLKACLRGLAAGLDVAAHNLTGDMTEVNYSSARIAELNERETWMALQDWFIENFTMPIYEQWLAMSLLAGAITFDITGKALPAERYAKFANASRFQGRRWSWVDPAKEAEANKAQLDSLLTSRTRLAAEQGEEFDDILDERQQEELAIKAAGLAPPPPPGRAGRL
jgi:lambda family phage portal protein